MKRHLFLIGLLLSLLGVGVIGVGLSMRPNVRDRQWRAKTVNVHLGWLIGSVVCLVGVILIIKDTIRNREREALQERERQMRDEILTTLPEARIGQDELGELIRWKYGTSGLFGLNPEQMAELQRILRRRVESNQHPENPSEKGR